MYSPRLQSGLVIHLLGVFVWIRNFLEMTFLGMIDPERWAVFVQGIIVLAFGAAGGFAQGLTQCVCTDRIGPSKSSDSDHSLESNGVVKFLLGHSLVGILGAFALLPFGIRILDLNLQVLCEGAALQSYEGLLKTSFFLISLSVLGGFSGHRVLLGLGRHVLDKILEKKTEDLDKTTKALTAKVQRQDEEMNKQYVELQKQEGMLLLYKAKSNIASDMSADALKDIDAFFRIHGDKHWFDDRTLAFAYVLRGMAFKRLGQFEQALKAVENGLKLEAPPAHHKSVLLYNRACYRTLSASGPIEGVVLENIIKDLTEAQQPKRRSQSFLNKEPDFEKIRSTNEFKAFVASAPVE